MLKSPAARGDLGGAQERRVAPRIEVVADVTMSAGARPIGGVALDISTGGVFVAVYAPLPEGTRMTLSIRLPDGRMQAEGVVRWVRPSSPGRVAGVGVEFVALDEDDLRILDACCRRPPDPVPPRSRPTPGPWSPHTAAQPSRHQYTSDVRVRRMDVLVVGIEPGDEPQGLDLSTLPVRVVRVRNAAPACERIRAVEPHVVLMTADLDAVGTEQLELAAVDAGAELLELRPGVSGAALRKELVEALQIVSARRQREQA
jgi:uncharacterized protein (TIGR02266 family)